MSNLVKLTSPTLKVVFDPNRGNIMTSLCAYGKELMYIDEENYASKERPRCGCPVLFPYMGALENNQLHLNGQIYDTGIHGIVHTNVWEVIKQTTQSASFQTTSNPQSMNVYPFEFILDTTITVKDNSLIYHVCIKNTSKQAMPCDIGFHPFFKMKDIKMTSLIIDDVSIPWSDSFYHSVTEGKLITDVKSITCKDMDYQFTIELTKNMKNIFLWSGQPNQFLVIEPWTTHVNAINERKQYFTIEPNGTCEVEWTLQIDEVV